MTDVIFLLMSNMKFSDNFPAFVEKTDVLAEYEERRGSFVYLEKSSPNWRHAPFFSSFGGGGKGFPVSFASGEIQLPVSRITRRFNGDKLSAPLCTYDKPWITDMTGNRLFWFSKCLDLKQKVGRCWPVDTHGLWTILCDVAAGIVEGGREGIASNIKWESLSFPDLVPHHHAFLFGNGQYLSWMLFNA